jgi:PBP1b-binding outer membrane lipoprotein LpoB
MNCKIFIILCSIVFLTACSGENEKKFEQKDKSFYPISSFIQSELHLIDSLPLAVFKYTLTELKTDTQLVEKPVFRKIAEYFISPDITIEPLKKNYTETVFMDATINTVTFSYTTLDTTAAIRKIDVFINPETDKVKNIYVEKITHNGDSLVTQKMIWTSGKYCQVSTQISKSGEAELIRKEKYSWDF